MTGPIPRAPSRPSPAPIRPVARRWACSSDLDASLTHYPASGRQTRHVHEHAQVSFLLAGELLEEVDGREHRPSGAAVGYKPAGAPHSDEWGHQGALLFTLRLHGDPGPHERGREPGWRRVGPSRVGALVRAFVEGVHPHVREGALLDLLSLDDAGPSHLGSPPAWLAKARAHLVECAESASIDEVAREAGVHRVQLSRVFRSHYGVPPSLFRRRVLVARAVAALVRSDASLSAAALEAGFWDQAHLNRCMRLETGLTPARLRTLLATSVQSPVPADR